jgi:hypothetical protein
MNQIEMKSVNLLNDIFFRLLPIFGFFLFLTSCGGGDNGTNSTPSISQLTVSNYNQDTTLSISLHFEDKGKDINTISVSLYNKSGSLLGTSPSAIDGLTGNESGTISGDLNFSTLDVGDYSMGIFLTDSKKLNSNTLTKDFSVEAGFGDVITHKDLADTVFLGDTTIGDLNGDGLNDVAVIEYANNTGLVVIYYQNASGGFDTPVTMDFDFITRGVVIADVNNDNRADLIVSNGNFIVMLQDSISGELLPPIEYISHAGDVSNIEIADLNNDGLNDVAIFGMSQISLFFQNSDRSLGPEVRMETDNRSWFCKGHIADMNNDGKNDIVIQEGGSILAVYKQISNGFFTSTPDLYVVQTSYMGYINTFALGDLNGDGMTDIVTLDPGNNGYINIFHQNPQGRLDNAVLVKTNYMPASVKVVDITGDGLNDIACEGMLVYVQNSDHTFSDDSIRLYPGESAEVAQTLSIRDVTGDGRRDAVVAIDGGINVFPHEKQIFLGREGSDNSSPITSPTTPPTLISIAVTTIPVKTVYNMGDSLDLNGLIVTGTYDDGSTKPITVTTSNITGFDSSRVGIETLTVTINDLTTKFGVIIRPFITNISVSKMPTKTAYHVGDTLDITGLVVRGTYSDGSSKIETIGASNITGFDSSEIGTKTLTVAINGKSALFKVYICWLLVENPINISNTADVYSQMSDLTVEKDTVNVIWQERGAEIRFSKSTDGGSSFIEPKIIYPWNYILQGWYPAISLDNENMHVAWTVYNKSYGTADIYYSHSSDNGSSFSTPNVISFYDGNNSYNPSIVSQNEYVGVVWDYYGSDFERIAYCFSDDNGVTFSTPEFSSSQSLSPDIALYHDNVYIVSIGAGYNNILFFKSEDRGQTFAVTNIPYPSTHQVWPPKIKVDSSGKIYILWQSGSVFGAQDAYLAISNDDGATFNVKKVISGVEKLNFVSSFDLNNEGNIYILWTEGDVSQPENSTQSFLIYSLNNGDTFSDPLPIYVGQAYPSIHSYGNDKIILNWNQNNSEGIPDVFSKIVDVSSLQ